MDETASENVTLIDTTTDSHKHTDMVNTDIVNSNASDLETKTDIVNSDAQSNTDMLFMDSNIEFHSDNNIVPDNDNNSANTEFLLTANSGTDPNLPQFNYTTVDFVLTVISLVTYIFDIGSDIGVAVVHFQNKDRFWGIFTILPIFYPCIVFLIWKDFCADYKTFWKMWLLTLPGGLIIFLIRNIHRGWKILREKSPQNTERLTKSALDKFNGIIIFRCYEAVFEAFPQLLLQMYILFSNPATSGAIQWGSVCISLASLSFTLTSVYTFLHQDKGKHKVSLIGAALVFVFLTLTLAARAMSLALWGVVSGRFLYVTFFFIFLKDFFCMYFLMKIGHVSVIISFINVIYSPYDSNDIGILKCTIFYIVIYIENVVMLLTWYFTTQPVYQWHRYLACVVILGGYVIGILCLAVHTKSIMPMILKFNKSIKDLLFFLY